MLIQPGALAKVPAFAAVPERALALALRELTPDGSEPRLARAFRKLEAAQPELAEFVAEELSTLEQGEAQALGYFLLVTVYLAFDEAFGARLRALERADIEAALEHLLADGEVRLAACRLRSYSEDAVALGQPVLMALVRDEVDDAAQRRIDVEPIMQAVLVAIVALSSAVVEAS